MPDQYLGSVPLPDSTPIPQPKSLVQQYPTSPNTSTNTHTSGLLVIIYTIVIGSCIIAMTKYVGKSKAGLFLKRIIQSIEGQILIRSALLLIGFILSYKWACGITHSGFNIDGTYHDHQPFKFETTWYIWIIFIITQILLQLPFIDLNTQNSK